MKKMILSAMMAFAFLASTSVMAQTPQKEAPKAKTEVKKEMKECTKGEKKECSKKDGAKEKSCSKKDAKAKK